MRWCLEWFCIGSVLAALLLNHFLMRGIVVSCEGRNVGLMRRRLCISKGGGGAVFCGHLGGGFNLLLLLLALSLALSFLWRCSVLIGEDVIIGG